MDRFFASLPIGKIVKRANWSISTNGDLFCLKGNHMTEGELGLVEGKGEGEGEEVDLKKTVLRCERQTLHRLPRTGGLVFSFVSTAFLLLVNGSLHMEGGHGDNLMCRKRICILYKSYAMRGAVRYWLKLSMGWAREVYPTSGFTSGKSYGARKLKHSCEGRSRSMIESQGQLFHVLRW
jgi:hypothetical protein